MHEKIGDKAELLILGDWLYLFSYGVFEEGEMKLKYFEAENKELPEYY